MSTSMERVAAKERAKVTKNVYNREWKQHRRKVDPKFHERERVSSAKNNEFTKWARLFARMQPNEFAAFLSGEKRRLYVELMPSVKHHPSGIQPQPIPSSPIRDFLPPSGPKPFPTAQEQEQRRLGGSAADMLARLGIRLD